MYGYHFIQIHLSWLIVNNLLFEICYKNKTDVPLVIWKVRYSQYV